MRDRRGYGAVKLAACLCGRLKSPHDRLSMVWPSKMKVSSTLYASVYFESKYQQRAAQSSKQKSSSRRSRVRAKGRRERKQSSTRVGGICGIPKCTRIGEDARRFPRTRVEGVFARLIRL